MTSTSHQKHYVKPQTHDEREARSEKNFCAHKSDITMSLTLLATDKT